MPDFDKNLQSVTEKVKTKLPESPLISIPTPDLNVALPDLSAQYASKEPLQKTLGGGESKTPFDEFFGTEGPTVTKMAPTITAQEAYEHRSYSTYNPDIVNFENQKSYNKSDGTGIFIMVVCVFFIGFLFFASFTSKNLGNKKFEKMD